jgi:hypothetical protein
MVSGFLLKHVFIGSPNLQKNNKKRQMTILIIFGEILANDQKKAKKGH